MAVRRPTLDQLRSVSEDLGMHMGEEELKSYDTLMQGNYAAYDAVDAMPDYVPAVKYPRTPGYRPEGEENKYNAWYVKTEIKGAPSGKLAGKKIALKDNISLAGVPMMNGASTLEGYIPDTDATIVTRMLDAGGTIVGKVHCEYFCFSGGSHTCAAGPVHNPHKMGYSAGGSSSGSAGVVPIELTIDHTGPMTNNVRDNALLLEVLAGADGLDPRQGALKIGKYSDEIGGGVRGLRIGVVKEGFGHPSSEADVDAKVKAGADLFRKLGATVEEISVPMHLVAPAIWLPIAAEGATEFMMKGNGMGTNWRGLYTTTLLDAHSGWKHRADELSDSLKITMLLGQYFTKHYRGHFYAKAQNLNRKLRATYDAALSKYDLLLMPTLPMKATPIPPPDAPRELYIQRAFEMVPNTAPFNATGHPAMSLPCGMSDGLPIGLMLIGKYYDESTIYRAAAAFESAGDWTKM